MHIQFSQSRPQVARLVAQVTDKDKVPAGLEKPFADGMEAARFKGKAGQVFDGFVERDGQVLRLALQCQCESRGSLSQEHVAQRNHQRQQPSCNWSV